MGICSNYSGLSQLVFIGALAICMAFVQSETVADSSPTLQNDNQDTLSGAGSFDVTTKVAVQDPTENSYTFDYDDGTHTITKEDEEEVVLGPGAITAIVIAVFLGASVLLALIVITLRKFTAS
ncbi:protein SNORC [Onychostoma macrolepis]|nr:protein SNORC [Onychostoma macrolepis]